MWEKYQRDQVILKMRPVTESDIKEPKNFFISPDNIKLNSPKMGDVIAQNPLNSEDQWLIEKSYFEKSFKKIINLNK